MRKRLSLLSVVAGVAISVNAAGASQHVLKGAEFLPQAKLSFADAARKALKARPGTITDRELEKEAGGIGLRFSFDVLSGGHTYEVGIDAKSGDLLENAAEGAHAD